MNALEIKPGKYRARDGSIVTVTNPTDQYWVGHGYAWRAADAKGIEFFVTADGRYRLYGDRKRMEAPLDLIERIEDEPKAEEKCQQKFPLRFAVSGMDAASVGDDQTCVVTAASSRENLVDETLKQFTAEFLSLGWRAKVAALEAKIARLEAENESLSRQLRSRALNSEPASAGKVWRWSPMV